VRVVIEGVAMTANQPDPATSQHNGEGPPAFRVVRRGYDPEEVDAYFSQLAARLNQAVDQYATAERARAELQDQVTSLHKRAPSFEQVGGEAAALLVEAGRTAEQMVENARRRSDTIIEKAQQQAEQLRDEVTNEAQKVLEQAREVADQIRTEVEAERAAVVQETDQVREFRDGLLDDLSRVHGEISGLLERTRKQRDEALGAAGATDPNAAAAHNGKAQKPTEPTKAAEDK
jgi:DivIVA domain-containing protein